MHDGRMHQISRLHKERARLAGIRDRLDEPTLKRRNSFVALEEFRRGNSSGFGEQSDSMMSDIKKPGDASKTMAVELNAAREYIKELEGKLEGCERDVSSLEEELLEVYSLMK